MSPNETMDVQSYLSPPHKLFSIPTICFTFSSVTWTHIVRPDSLWSNVDFEREVTSHWEQASKSTQICATSVIFLSLFSCNFDDQLNNFFSQICYFMHRYVGIHQLRTECRQLPNVSSFFINWKINMVCTTWLFTCSKVSIFAILIAELSLQNRFLSKTAFPLFTSLVISDLC